MYFSTHFLKGFLNHLLKGCRLAQLKAFVFQTRFAKSIKRPLSATPSEVVSMENQIKKQDTNEAKAKRILAKASYLNKIARDEDVYPAVSDSLAKAIYYLYVAAYMLDDKNRSFSSIWLNMVSDDLGL